MTFIGAESVPTLRHRWFLQLRVGIGYRLLGCLSISQLLSDVFELLSELLVGNFELLVLLTESVNLSRHLGLLGLPLFLNPLQLLLEVLNLLPLLLIRGVDHLHVPLPLLKRLPLLLELLELIGLDALKVLELALLLRFKITEVHSLLREELVIVSLEPLGLLILLIVGLYCLIELLHLGLQHPL